MQSLKPPEPYATTIIPPALTTDWQPFLVYAWYRVLLSALLAAAYLIVFNDGDRQALNANLYLGVSLSYMVVCCGTVGAHYRFKQWQKPFALWSLIIDVLAIAFLAHASGGMSSHLIILLVVCVAASTILLDGLLATFMAAFATLAILTEQLFFTLTQSGNSSDWVRTGILGIVLFSTSLLAQRLASRLRASEAYAQATANDLVELQKLNHYIIQRMRTGVMVVDEMDTIQLYNAAAAEHLGLDGLQMRTAIQDTCPQLAERLTQWRADETVLITPFRASDDCIEVSPNFALLNRSKGNQVIIFLDDTSRLTQQAQQLKLASLGQLTAAIAHEVRNPLGAISHAAQLLMESEALEKTDRQMTDIIQHHCLRVNGIIENVLQLSRRNTAMIQPLQLAEWVETFIANFTRSASQPCDIDLSELTRCWVQVDPNQLTQVLTNLVENGLRYSEQQSGQRVLTLRSGHINSSDLPFLEVIDQGPGVPESAQSRLFEPFYTSEASGTGLGLYIARELCEINHASLSYIQRTETGACFRITFAHSSKLLAS